MFLGWCYPFRPMVRLGNVWGFWSSHLRLNAKCLGTGMDDECITISPYSFGQTCQSSPTRTLEICHTVGMLDCKDSHQDGLNMFKQTSWFASLWKGSLLLRFHGALLKWHVEKSVVEVNWMSICASTNQPPETSRSSADGQAKVLNCPPPDPGIRRIRQQPSRVKCPTSMISFKACLFLDPMICILKTANSRYSIPYPSLVSVMSSQHRCPLPPDSPSQPDQSFIDLTQDENTKKTKVFRCQTIPSQDFYTWTATPASSFKWFQSRVRIESERQSFSTT